MSGFPSLQPAFTMMITIDPPMAVGNVSRGAPLNVVNLPHATLKSEPGFQPAVDAEIIFGSDFIRADPSQKHVRLDVRSLFKDKSGALINLSYTGYIEVTPDVAKVFQGTSDAAKTDFGHSFTHVVFETGDERLKSLEAGEFVAAGRFVVEQGKKPVVEYKVSKLVL